jgi:pimeloyl-ACP methyl ester carboxylesterase
MNKNKQDNSHFIYKDINKGSDLKIVFLSGLGLDIRRQREGFLRRFALLSGISYLALDYTKYVMHSSGYSLEKINNALTKTLEVLNQNPNEKLILIGGCFGGLMALKIAEKLPNRTIGSIVFSPAYETDNFPMVDITQSLLEERINSLKRRRADAQMINKLVSFKEMIITAFKTHSKEEIHPTYKGPLSIFHGQSDNLIPVENSHHVKKALKNPHCHVHVIKKTGHSLNRDFEMKRPLRVLKALLNKNSQTRQLEYI